MKIVILFTSANPLTKAHIAMLKAAVKALNADKGLFVAMNVFNLNLCRRQITLP